MPRAVPTVPTPRARAVLLAAALALLAPACARTPLAPLAFHDERTGTVVAEPTAVVAAASHALEDLDLRVESSRFDADGGIVVARSPLDDRVRIEIERGQHHATRLTVQAEWLHDGRLASTVYDRIRAEL